MTAMTPSEASKQLGIQPSTLRKYCLLLEQNGVTFARNANNSRQYSDMNLVTLQRMITLLRSGDMSVEDAAYASSRWSKGEDETVDIDDMHNAVERHNDDIAAAMVKEIHSLKEEISEQKKIIEEFRVTQEKRDAYFVQILEELNNEVKRLNEQQALPEPEEAEPEDSPKMDQPPVPEKKGFFSRLFGKKE